MPVRLSSLLLRLFSGYSFRNGIEHQPDGSLSVIQMKDLENDYTSIGSELTTIHMFRSANKMLLAHGDVLFLCKGARPVACCYDLDRPQAIASSAFFVLRPDPEKVAPGYIAWYINQPLAQQFLQENTSGAAVKNINKTTVERIPITLPPRDVQEKIVAVDALLKREFQLMREIKQRRDVLINSAMRQLAGDQPLPTQLNPGSI